MYLHCAGREFHPNSGLGVCVEFSCAKSAQEVRFAYSRVADDHQLEEVVVPARFQLGFRPEAVLALSCVHKRVQQIRTRELLCEGDSLIVVGVLDLLSHLESLQPHF